MSIFSALVQPIRGSQLADVDRRNSTRFISGAAATSHPIEGNDPIFWGATIRDVSTGGIGLSMCYPFRQGTYLNVNLRNKEGHNQAVLARVVHVRDQADGTWLIGCEFPRPLSNDELDSFVE